MDQGPLQVSPDDMLRIIGKQQIEIEILRTKVAERDAAVAERDATIRTLESSAVFDGISPEPMLPFKEVAS